MNTECLLTLITSVPIGDEEPSRAVFIVHPSLAADLAPSLGALDADVYVAAQIDVPAVPLATWLAMTQPPPAAGLH